MALKLGELVAYLKTDKRQLATGLADAKQDVRAAGRDMERDAETTAKAMAAALAAGGREAGERFWRDAAGRLRDQRGRFAAAGQELGRAAGQGAASGLSSLSGALTSLGNTALAIGSNLTLLVPVLAALAAGAVFAIPAVYALGGALASLPALAAGGAAAIATLAIGFQGLAEAFKSTSRSGGSVVDRAYEVARAERQVRDANREVLDSQIALNRARSTAAENLQDLNRGLAAARLDEESAVLAVAEAERDLRAAQRGGNRLETQRAELALRQAQQSVLDVRDRVEDLAAEQEEASRKGVEGSDEVTAALRRQERAVEGVADAEHALAQARRGSGGGAAGEATRLAASAAGLVGVLKGLKPAWEDLRLSVQQRLFAGVGQEVRLLADAWLPRLKAGLGRYADTFNSLFKEFSKSARDPEFMGNISVGLEAVRGLIGDIGSALAGPGTRAFGQLVRAARPFIDMLGSKISGAITSFSNWIDKAEKSGKLNEFFKTAAKYLGEIWDLTGDLGAVAADFFSIWTDTTNADESLDLFDTIRQGLKDLREWLKDPENRERVRQFVDGFTAIGTVVMNIVGWIIGTAIPAVYGWFVMMETGWNAVADAAGAAVSWIVGKWDSLVKAVQGLPDKISSASNGMWNGIKESFRAAINWIIGKWNGLSFTLPGFSAFGHQVGGGTLGTKHINYLANGGDILRPGIVRVGDRGMEDVYLPAGAQVRPLDGSPPPGVPRGGEAGGSVQTLEIIVGGDLVDRRTRKTVRVQGGRTDRVLVGRGAL